MTHKDKRLHEGGVCLCGELRKPAKICENLRSCRFVMVLVIQQRMRTRR